MIRAVVIVEGEVFRKRGVLEFASTEELDAYRAGFSAGAVAYGGGTWGVYTLADLDDPEEREFMGEAVAALVRAALRKRSVK